MLIWTKWILAAGIALQVGASTTEIDTLERLARLSSPALLILFIWLLGTGRLVWRRELDRVEAEREAWKQAAIGRMETAARGATVADAALHSSGPP